MRTYSIDQLDEKDIAAITARFTEMGLQAGLDGVFWLPMPPDMLSPVQKEHEERCGPYCMALEVEPDSVHLELLVRGMGRIICDCVSFAAPELRNHMFLYLEDVLTDLGIVF